MRIESTYFGFSFLHYHQTAGKQTIPNKQNVVCKIFSETMIHKYLLSLEWYVFSLYIAVWKVIDLYNFYGYNLEKI